MNNFKRQALPILILIFPLSLMLAAWVFYNQSYLKQDSIYTGTTHNQGILMRPPILISDTLPNTPRRWSLIIPGEVDCDTLCVRRLYDTRQAHIALGREAWRLRRVYWSENSPATKLRDFIAEHHPGMELRVATALSSSFALPEADFYLVDPKGFLMMHYNNQHSSKDLLEDLKFLLRISR